MLKWKYFTTQNASTTLEEAKREYAQASRAFWGMVDPFLQAQFGEDGLPEHLCHYTDFNGLRGILESGSVWATSSRAMNDAAEGHYGRYVIQKFLSGSKEAGSSLALENAKTVSKMRAFACSFCNDGQVLSMWLTYASRGGGYCLVFDGSGSNGMLSCSFPPFSARLPMRMTYGEIPPLNVGKMIEMAGKFVNEGKMEAMVAVDFTEVSSQRLRGCKCKKKET